ncbi:hypothetical protein DQ04_05771010 [Trypanosoma grayi]|uniref:hypothetical protein n=1 Tax=Trypanosoma grayi TaxID=71804 RepID=UPI0004F40B0A|nr:hypothetical protein DQ04_05771010 [Trypanosoma grayi]KEG09118.1 hypothetical protein DQ04_05771010 [Trypanosoma grayi]
MNLRLSGYVDPCVVVGAARTILREVKPSHLVPITRVGADRAFFHQHGNGRNSPGVNSVWLPGLAKEEGAPMLRKRRPQLASSAPIMFPPNRHPYARALALEENGHALHMRNSSVWCQMGSVMRWFCRFVVARGLGIWGESIPLFFVRLQLA